LKKSNKDNLKKQKSKIKRSQKNLIKRQKRAKKARRESLKKVQAPAAHRARRAQVTPLKKKKPRRNKSLPRR